MAYRWDTILATDESIQKEFTISKAFQIIVLIVVILCSLAVGFSVYYIGIAIFLLGFLYWLYTSNSKHYAFTNKRVILVNSFLGKSVVSIDYKQITDIEIEQSAIDQIAGWGTLVINTAGTNAPEIRLAFITSPEAVKQALDTIKDSQEAKTIL